METTIQIAIVVLIFAIVIAMFWSVRTSKQLSIIVFSVIFFGIAISVFAWQGFTQQAFENVGYIAFILFTIRLVLYKKIANAARVRTLSDWMDKKSLAICEMCGTKLSYQQVPKNLSLLICYKFTCPNCGAKSKVDLDTSNKDNANYW